MMGRKRGIMETRREAAHLPPAKEGEPMIQAIVYTSKTGYTQRYAELLA